MKPVENETLLKQLRWRYATEKFDPTKKIPAEDWNTLEQALIATPSSFGLQPWHFVVITSQELKDKLVSASWGQQQVSQASHVVVFAVKKDIDADYVQKCASRSAEVRGLPIERLDGFKRSVMKLVERQDSSVTEAWLIRQVYIALGNLLTCAAMLGIDACPMEGIEPGKYDQILGLPARGYATMLIATLGYRAADDAAANDPKVRFSAEELVTRL
jgi:nitroreductase